VSETPFGPPYLQQSETLAECAFWVSKAGFPKGTGQPKEMHVGSDGKTRGKPLDSKRGDDEGIVRYFFPCRSIPKVGSKAEVPRARKRPGYIVIPSSGTFSTVI
jgi:hypothetical protein